MASLYWDGPLGTSSHGFGPILREDFGHNNKSVKIYDEHIPQVLLFKVYLSSLVVLVQELGKLSITLWQACDILLTISEWYSCLHFKFLFIDGGWLLDKCQITGEPLGVLSFMNATCQLNFKEWWKNLPGFWIRNFYSCLVCFLSCCSRPKIFF